jgi:hypothetical protein
VSAAGSSQAKPFTLAVSTDEEGGAAYSVLARHLFVSPRTPVGMSLPALLADFGMSSSVGARMSDLYGLPIITNPNLPEGTALVVNPDVLIMPHFEIGPISGPFITENDIHFTWKPMSHLSMPHSWQIASIYGIATHDEAADAFTYAMLEPVKYRGLARVVHMLRKMLDKLRH